MTSPSPILLPFDLDARGEAYVREHLTNVNVLSSALLEVVMASRGRTWTLAPSATAIDHLHDFARGGLLVSNLDFSRAIPVATGGTLMPVDSLHLERAERVLETMARFPGSVCVVDDFNPTWGDGVYQPEPTAFGVGGEVYHLATGTETPDEMADLLALGDTVWHGVSAVCAPAGRVTRADLSSATALRACASTVVEITCTAYDREGFVIWTRETAAET